MGFFGAGAESVFRDRRKLVTDPYNPDRPTQGSWEDDLDTIPLPGCFVSTTSTSLLPNNARREGIVYKSLFIPSAGADVRVDDRIRTASTDGSEHIYSIQGIPAADTNPWSGWRPVLEVPLQEVIG